MMTELQARLKKLTKKLGEDVMLRMEELPRHIGAVPTGCLALNHAIGKVGGWPRGRFSMVWGPASGGKTTLGIASLAEVKRLAGENPYGGECCYIEVEGKDNPDHNIESIEAYGVSPTGILTPRVKNGIEALEIVKALIGVVDLVVVDSVKHLTLPSEIDSDAGDIHWAKLAKLMSQQMKNLAPTLKFSETAVLLINQETGTMDPYNPTQPPGGRGLRHQCSVIFHIRKIQQIKQGKVAVAQKSRARNTKNQVGVPYKSAEFQINFHEEKQMFGIDMLTDIIEMDKQLGVLSTSPGRYQIGDEKWHGEKLFKPALRESNELFNEARRLIMDALTNPKEETNVVEPST